MEGRNGMKKRKLKLCLAAGLLLLLTGCFSQTLDDLYAQPKAPEDYLKLDNKINEVLNQGGEYAAPLSGELTQKVQLQDLDGDGVKEAIAFFRVTNNEDELDKPLKIYIYHRVEEDYEVAAIIEGTGSAIGSVYYEDLDGSPSKEIVVSWQVSGLENSVAVYSIEDYEVVELMRTGYTDFKLFDLDADGQKEIVVVQTEGEKRAELYNFRNGVLELESAAPLSKNSNSLADGGVRTGMLRDNVPAVFVSSIYAAGMDTGITENRITDIFAWRDGRLENVTLDLETGESGVTIRVYGQVSGTDINGDSIMELPAPYMLPELSRGQVTNFWAIRWQQFDIDGTAWPVFTTYHNDRDGWYFILPDEWEGKILLSRSDQTGGGERAVNFYYWDGDESATPVKFLTIYKLTGDNRVKRANQAGRFRLLPAAGDASETLYAASLYPGNWDCGLDEEGVRANFALILGG